MFATRIFGLTVDSLFCILNYYGLSLRFFHHLLAHFWRYVFTFRVAFSNSSGVWMRPPLGDVFSWFELLELSAAFAGFSRCPRLFAGFSRIMSRFISLWWRYSPFRVCTVSDEPFLDDHRPVSYWYLMVEIWCLIVSLRTPSFRAAWAITHQFPTLFELWLAVIGHIPSAFLGAVWRFPRLAFCAQPFLLLPSFGVLSFWRFLCSLPFVPRLSLQFSPRSTLFTALVFVALIWFSPGGACCPSS